jgi:NAD(P)-dependent dehydrogenase (short-subunit alcohol dehydrogenase family)
MKTKSISRLFNLTGKAAVITGGAMGIGESIGLRLAEAGARVMIADVDLEKAEQTVEEIRAMEREAQAVYADVSRKDDVMELIRATLKAFGGLDILVNNAGISSQPFLPVMETQEENWDRVFEVNLKGMFLLSQAAGREMIKQGKGGRIINITSLIRIPFS